MGQYYRPVFLEDQGNAITGWLSCYDYGNGAKLMEHSWVGNEFMTAVESQLSTPTRLVWAGDYADPEPGTVATLYAMAGWGSKISPDDPQRRSGRFVINHDRGLYVDKQQIPANADGWTVHPLSVLTAEGNGRGGGDLAEDYTTGNFALVGTWARDRVSVGEVVPDGFDRLAFDLVEA
ncbi:hypothetical protein [Nocardia asteroides]